DRGSRRFVAVPLPAPSGKVPAPWSFLEDSAGRIWIGTIRQGAFVVDPNTGVARAVQQNDPVRPAGQADIQSAGVASLVEVVPGEVWLGTLGQGIVAVDTNTWRTRAIRHDP